MIEKKIIVSASSSDKTVESEIEAVPPPPQPPIQPILVAQQSTMKKSFIASQGELDSLATKIQTVPLPKEKK